MVTPGPLWSIPLPIGLAMPLRTPVPISRPSSSSLRTLILLGSSSFREARFMSSSRAEANCCRSAGSSVSPSTILSRPSESRLLSIGRASFRKSSSLRSNESAPSYIRPRLICSLDTSSSSMSGRWPNWNKRYSC